MLFYLHVKYLPIKVCLCLKVDKTFYYYILVRECVICQLNPNSTTNEGQRMRKAGDKFIACPGGGGGGGS